MRNRLIAKLSNSKKGTLGYTLVEVLVVVGIIAALCAIVIPSLIWFSRTLQFKQANDHAKSIFMAAQQNLSEMRAEGALRPLQQLRDSGEAERNTPPIPAGTGFPTEFQAEYVYTYTGKEAYDLVLPMGSIDGTVRDGNVIIEYNPVTGNVYAVYYTPKASVAELVQLYTGAQISREDEAARKKQVVGYYDGSGLNSSQLELEKTSASINYINGEEGIVEVLVPMPEAFYGDHQTFAEALQVDLVLTGEQYMEEVAAGAATPDDPSDDPLRSGTIMLPMKAEGDTGFAMGADGKTIVLQMPIDSLLSRQSFANHAAVNNAGKSLTAILSETGEGVDASGKKTTVSNFHILPGENITIQANVTCNVDGLEVKIDPGILTGVNPLFESLQASGNNRYVITLSNGRNLQNLNILAPSIAKNVESVVFTSDIYWNRTVNYYNNLTGSHATDEAPARHLPYFVPIHHMDLFGSATFIFPGDSSGGGIWGWIGDLIGGIFDAIFNGGWGSYNNKDVPALTDELDALNASGHATIQGMGYKVYNLNIDATKYAIPNKGTNNEGKFYAAGELWTEQKNGNKVEQVLAYEQIVDHQFTGLFGYANTSISKLHVVNPIVKGSKLTGSGSSSNNPATGALLGAGGFNTLITDCSVYIDTTAEGYNAGKMGQGDYSANTDQGWYGVSGEGAVGGMVGYCKSHQSVTGELDGDTKKLAFARCFAAVPVSGNMRTSEEKDFGYSNGVGGLIGNSQLTNFYQCYASGNVRATGLNVEKSGLNSIADILMWLEDLIKQIIQWVGEIFGIDFGYGSKVNIFGETLELPYNGRTSWGAGGFVGTSHGTHYTNCFATGNVTGKVNSGSRYTRGAGGFVGFMSIDETKSYGGDASTSAEIAQRTVFRNCYAVGRAVANSSVYEGFSGGNGRISGSSLVINGSSNLNYMVANYYQLLAPHYALNNGTEPDYQDYYIYKDCYFLSDPDHSSGQNQLSSQDCAEPLQYDYFINMPSYRSVDSEWVQSQVDSIKGIPLTNRYDFGDVYFSIPGLEDLYKRKYADSFSFEDWGNATEATTHPYNLNTTGTKYPFSKLNGLDYYGDWPSRPAAMGMAYYEQYDNGIRNGKQQLTEPHYYFDRAHTDPGDDARLNLSSEDIVAKDGYAIFSTKSSSMSVKIGNGQTYQLNSSANDSAYIIQVDSSKYQVFHMTDAMIAEARSQLTDDTGTYTDFYVKITATQANLGTYTMYFNPDVAVSHVNPGYGSNGASKPDSVPGTIRVRSAGQFAALHNLPMLWDSEIIQELHVDADVYAALTAPVALGSIGDASKAFTGSYSYVNREGGDSKARIEGFTPTEAGFFGNVSATGHLENLQFNCGSVTAGGNTYASVGVVAGTCYGSLANVDLTVTGTVELTGLYNAGTLVGYGTDYITDCDVDANIVNLTAPSSGGLMGSMSGTEDTRLSLEDCAVTVKDLNITCTGEDTAAGGLVGTAYAINGVDLTVQVTKLSASADYAGGLAGSMQASSLISSKVTLPTASNGAGIMGGVLGSTGDTSLTDVELDSKGTISGNVAAGLIGTSGSNVKATNCHVSLNHLTGRTQAAGVAGTIGVNGMFENTTIGLTGTLEATEGDAAGFVGDILAGGYARAGSNVTLGSNAQIKGSAKAAGYAVNVDGTIDMVSVRGKATILSSAGEAAGFAVSLGSGRSITNSAVTPASGNSDYLGNANANLLIQGATKTSGFVGTVGKDATVNACYVLGKVSGGAASGFAGSNGGTIQRCTANVNILSGYAFVTDNTGLIVRSYGWYDNSNGDSADTTTMLANTVGGTGSCFSCYFADLLNPVSETESGDVTEQNSVVLYDADGVRTEITASQLSGGGTMTSLTQGKSQKFVWNKEGDEYPYSSALKDKNYPYPMQQTHYGDWSTAPQFAYGVAYYEVYGEDINTAPVKLHLMDLSNSAETVEKKDLSGRYIVNPSDTIQNADLINEGEIKSWGYAVFSKKGQNMLTNAKEALTNVSLDVGGKTITYSLYAITGENVPEAGFAGAVGTQNVMVDVRFADAMAKANEAMTYQVRTPGQLLNLNQLSGKVSVSMTHDIVGVVLDSAHTVSDFQGTFTRADDVNMLGFVNLNAPLFAKVSGTVTLPAVKINNLNTGFVTESTGTVTMGSVTVEKTSVASGEAAQAAAPASKAAIFGNVSGSFTTGAITVGTAEAPCDIAQVFGNAANVTTGAITVNGSAGQVFGAIKSGTNTVGDIQVTGTLSAQVFGDVEGGSLTTGAITTGAVKNVFGAIRGTTHVNGNIQVNGKATQVFGAIAATLNTGNISTQDITNVFGAVGGAATVTGNIQVNGAATQVFGAVSSSAKVTGSITTSNITHVISSVASAGKLELGNITVNGNVATAVCGTIEAGSNINKVGTITVNGNAPQVFGTVGAALETGNISVNGIAAAGETAAVPAQVTQVFGDVNGSLTTGAITVNGTTDKVFGNVSGATTVTGDLLVTGTAGSQVFGEIKAALTTQNITTGAVTNVFGAVNNKGSLNTLDVTVHGSVNRFCGNIAAGSKLTSKLGAITIHGDVTSYVFGNVGYDLSLETGAIIVDGTAEKAATVEQVFGTVNGSLTTGAITIGTAEKPADVSKIAASVGIETGGVTQSGSSVVDIASVEIFGNPGKVFGSVGKRVQTMNVGAITVHGQVTDQVFGDVATGLNVTGAILVEGKVTNQVFGTITGSTTTQAITIGTTADPCDKVQVFGLVNSSLEVRDTITVNGTAGSVFGNISSGTVSTKAITVNGKVETQVFGDVSTGLTVQGAININGKVEKVFGAINDGTTSTQAITLGTAASPCAAVQVFGTVKSTLTVNGAILVNGNAGKIITSVSGGTVTLNDVTVDTAVNTLFGNVTGTLQGAAKTTKVKVGAVTGSLFAGTNNGTIQNFTVEAASLNTSLIGSASGSKDTISGITLKATTLAEGFSGNALLLGTLPAGGTVSGCTIESTTYTISLPDQGTFGGLVGTNNGTVSGSTVNASFTVTGNGTFGGLVGISSGSLTGNTPSVTINANGDANKTIGVLAGRVTGGEISGGTVAGAVNKTGGSGKTYVIGGVIGEMTGGTVKNVKSTVTVDSGWAVSGANSGTFGDATLDKGPVGMFVGYAASGELNGCSSTAANSTYQFVGQAAVSTQNLPTGGTVYRSDKLIPDAAAIEWDDGDPTYVFTIDGTEYTLTASTTSPYVTVDLIDCTFTYGTGTKKQEYGANQFYYGTSSAGQPGYSVSATPLSSRFATSGDLYGSEVYKNGTEADNGYRKTDYFLKSGDSYSRIYINEKVESYGIATKYTYKVKWLLSDGTYSEMSYSYTVSFLGGSVPTLNSKVGTLGTLTIPSISDGNYLAIADNQAYTKAGTAIPYDKATFDGRDALASAIWKAGDLTVGATIGADYYAALPSMTQKVGEVNCQIYRLSTTENAYYLVTFTRISDSSNLYNRQVLIATDVPAPASVEEAGGETPENS